MGIKKAMEGSGRFLAEHPVLYGASLLGAVGTAGYAVVKATRPGSAARRRWYALLAVECLAEAVAIVVVTERARRTPPAAGSAWTEESAAA